MCTKANYKGECRTVTLTDGSCTKIAEPYFENLGSAKAGPKSYVRVYSAAGCAEANDLVHIMPEGNVNLGNNATKARWVLGYAFTCTGCWVVNGAGHVTCIERGRTG